MGRIGRKGLNCMREVKDRKDWLNRMREVKDGKDEKDRIELYERSERMGRKIGRAHV